MSESNMTLHPCCPDEELVIDGLYRDKGGPLAVAFSCKICGTSGAVLWGLAPAWMRAKALEKEREK